MICNSITNLQLHPIATVSRRRLGSHILCGALLLVGCLSSGAAQDTTPSALESDAAGWIDVLPAADLKGWSRVPVPPKARLGREQWHVDAARRLLVCDGDGGHDMLLWSEPLGDAVLHVEFKYTKLPTNANYNSGIYIRNSSDGSVWHQAQFGSQSGGYLFGATLKDGKKKSFNLAKQVPEGRVKPAGEWNTLELTARGPVLTLWINGAVTCQFNDCGAPTGLLGLEGEGYPIEFRNLKVKKLMAPGAP